MRIGLFAGELSADNMGADFMRQFRRIVTDVSYCGHGGEAMKAAGMDCIDIDVEAFGILEILVKIPSILRQRRILVDYLVKQKIDVFIGIDMPDFVIGLEEKLHEQGIKTVHLVSPTIWAWRASRKERFLKANDRILCIFPFECAVYQNPRAVFVGHPLARSIAMENSATQARMKLNLQDWINTRKLVSILPGSRTSEINKLLPHFVETARQCYDLSDGGICFLISAANNKLEQRINQLLANTKTSFDFRVILGNSNDVIAAADTVIVASGTASLQTLLIKRPMIIAHRVNILTAWLVRLIISSDIGDRFGMPNLLAGDEIVPEFIQENLDAKRMALACIEQLNQDNSALIDRFREIHRSLQSDYSVADAVAELMEIER